MPTSMDFQGGHAVFYTCLTCGAAVVLHKAEPDLNPLALHVAWHEKANEARADA